MRADAAEEKIPVKGGIDLDGRAMRLDQSGQQADIHFDQAMMARFARGDFAGVRPVILEMTVMPGVLPLLGRNPTGQKPHRLTIQTTIL